MRRICRLSFRLAFRVDNIQRCSNQSPVSVSEFMGYLPSHIAPSDTVDDDLEENSTFQAVHSDCRRVICLNSRKSSPGFWGVFRSTLGYLALGLFLVSSSLAQTKSEGLQAETGKKGELDPLLNSAIPAPHLSRDRISTKRFIELRKAIDSNELGKVESLAKPLLDLPEDSWIGEGSLLHGLRHELIHQLNQLPRHLREISLIDANARAERDLAGALEKNDVTEILKLVRRYQGTPASHNALRQAALRCWDRGDFADAAMIAARSLPIPSEATAAQLPVILHTAAARVRSGEMERARSLLSQYAKLFDSESPREAQRRIDAALASYVAPELSGRAPGHPEFVFPAVFPRYSKPVLDDPNWTEFFDLAAREQKSPGTIQLPAAFPCIAKDKLLLRTYTSLVALDLLTGEKVWECEAMSAKPDPKVKRRSLENLSFRDLMEQDLLKFLLLNQVSGSCVADDQNAYFIADHYIETVVRKYPQPGSSPRNQLMACRLSDGEIVWQAWVFPELAEICFMSQPILQSGRLYLLGETDTEIRLFVIKCADGTLDWQMPLASNDKLSLHHHPSRSLRQMQLLWHDGWLICPTGVGCVVAIDTITRSYEWAYRYVTQEELPKSGGRLGGGGSATAKVVPHLEWQRAGLARDESRVYLASPESAFLHAIDATSGELVWRQPRQDGVFLAGLVSGKLLVVGLTTIKGLDPSTGNVDWQLEIERPSGCGCIQAGNYLLPLRTGQVLLIEAATGKILRGAHGDQQALGNLIEANGVLVSLTPKKLEVYGSWESEHQELLTRLKVKPDDAQLLKLMYSQMRRGGDMSSVVDLLRDAYKKDPLPAVRLQLILALVENVTTNPDRRDELINELRPLVSQLGRQPDELRCRILASRAMRLPANALAAAIELAALVTQEEFEVGIDKQTQVRGDRALQGMILQLFKDASEAERPRLEQQMDQALEAARNSNDPFTIQRFSVQMSELPWGHQSRLRDRGKTRIGWPIYRQELSLLDLAEHPDPTVAAPALWAMAQDLTERSFRHDAVRFDRILLDRFAGVRVDAHRTASEAVAALPGDSLVVRELTNGPTDPWPATKPVISKPKGKVHEPFLMPIPIEAPSGSLLDRVNVSVQSHPGAMINRLICQGNGFPGYWEIPLPKSRSPLAGLQETYLGWGFGQLLVVRFGTQLHGVSLLDNTGEPNGRVVWSLDMAEDASGSFEVTRPPARQGLGGIETVVVDEFGREIGQLHIMRPGYFCFRHRNEIVLVETATGRVAWRRHTERNRLRMTGDAAYVYLVDGRDSQVEVLRVVDGVSVQTLPITFSSEPPLILSGGLAIATELVEPPADSADAPAVKGPTDRKLGSRELKLRWYRLGDMGLLQEQPLVRNARKFLLDTQTLGVLNPDKSLVWFDLWSGRELGRTELDVTSDISQVHVWQDPYRFYVLPSGIPPNYNLQRVRQIRSGLRQHLVHGTLHAIDRKAGQVIWRRKFEDTFVALDQPHGAPIFLFNFQTLAAHVKEPADPPAPGEVLGVIQVIDRRTGEDLYVQKDATLAPEFTVELNVEDRWLDLHGVTERIRVEYPQD